MQICLSEGVGSTMFLPKDVIVKFSDIQSTMKSTKILFDKEINITLKRDVFSSHL